MRTMLAVLGCVLVCMLAACGGAADCYEQDGELVCVDSNIESVEQAHCKGGGGRGVEFGDLELKAAQRDKGAELQPSRRAGSYCDAYGWSALCPLKGSFEVAKPTNPDPTGK